LNRTKSATTAKKIWTEKQVDELVSFAWDGNVTEFEKILNTGPSRNFLNALNTRG
jgi:hypothetical protein